MLLIAQAAGLFIQWVGGSSMTLIKIRSAGFYAIQIHLLSTEINKECHNTADAVKHLLHAENKEV